MQLIILTVVCAKCKQTNQVMLSDQSKGRPKCGHCGAFLLDYFVVNGFVYVLDNPSMPGLVKIGFTSRSVKERVQEFNTATPVPENFEIVAYFGCTDPVTDEKTVHQAFNGSRLREKEFFRISITEAVNKIKTILVRQPLFTSESFKILEKIETSKAKELRRQQAPKVAQQPLVAEIITNQNNKTDEKSEELTYIINFLEAKAKIDECNILRNIIKLNYLNGFEIKAVLKLLSLFSLENLDEWCLKCRVLIASVETRRYKMSL